MDIIDIVLSKKYTDESLKGITGTLAGKNCTIKSATKADGVTTVVFAWTADDGTEKTTTVQVNDGAKGDIGIGIDNVAINANSHLIVTLSDGSTIDAGLIQGGSGTDDYEDLINRPKIEGVDLIGNKTFEDLGVASATDLAQTNDSLSVIGKCKNLLNPTLQTTTMNGVTCTANGDGTYTLNGTATADCYFILNSNFDLDSGKSYKLIGNPGKSDGSTSGSDYRLDFYNGNTYTGEYGRGAIITAGTTNKVQIIISNGVTISNLVVKPMLTTDLYATYDDFVPYTGDGDTLTHDVAEIRNDLDKIKPSVVGSDWNKSWTYTVSSTTPKMFALHWSNSTVIFCVFYGKVIPFNQPFAEETYTANVDGNTLTVTTSETGILRTI